jgi:hypothetical protein
VVTDFTVCGWDRESNNEIAIKEGIPITLGGTISYFSNKISFVITDSTMGQIRYSVEETSADYNKNPWLPNGKGGWESNPYVYSLNSIEPIPQPSTKSTYTTYFTITATTAGKKIIVNTGRIKVFRHTNPRIYFTKLEYSNNYLSGSYVIRDLGYDDNSGGEVEQITIKN